MQVQSIKIWIIIIIDICLGNFGVIQQIQGVTHYLVVSIAIIIVTIVNIDNISIIIVIII